MTNTRPDRNRPIRGATRFFWVWLTMATAASVAGNVTHAIMNAANGSAGLAAAAAIVPPVVLLGSTHSVALLVKARQTGRIYWCALLVTVALAGCAFVLSFGALAELAITAGMHADRAWLWPCAIDLSITQSTLALLSLNGSPCRDDPPSLRRPIGEGEAYSPSVKADAPRDAGDGAPLEAGVGATASAASDSSARPPDAPVDPTSWHPAAHQLVDAGVTQKDPTVVAQILAEHAAGTRPSTISRRLGVHHGTVGRILAGAEKMG